MRALILGVVLAVVPIVALAQDAIALQGTGQTATETFWLPEPQSLARFTHDGRSNFAVTLHGGNRPDLIINKIGAYDGYRLLSADSPIMLDIVADGRWRAEISPIPWSGEVAFSGRGDSVSGRFDPPANGAWTLSHDGRSNFAVLLHCADRRQLIQNRIGAAEGSQVITFGRGPCFWEVEADGAWSLAPR